MNDTEFNQKMNEKVLVLVGAIADIFHGEKKVVIKSSPSVVNGVTGEVTRQSRLEIKVVSWTAQ